MRRVVVGFSGGVTSAWCAGWALRTFPREEVNIEGLEGSDGRLTIESSILCRTQEQAAEIARVLREARTWSDAKAALAAAKSRAVDVDAGKLAAEVLRAADEWVRCGAKPSLVKTVAYSEASDKLAAAVRAWRGSR